MQLENRVAIITGGGHGIGRAYCLRFAQEGARVVVADIDQPAAERVAAEVQALGRHSLALGTDVANEESTHDMARQTMDRFGRIDALITNAAVFATIPISRGFIEDIAIEEFDRVLAVNVKGVFLQCRAVLPYMKEQRYGKIINISSTTVFSGAPGRIHYTASKGAVIAMTRTLAREVGQYNICVNVIGPGSTLTEDNPTDEIRRLQSAVIAGRALQRVQEPADLAGTAVFLASADSDFITGQTVLVNGGGDMH
jgi:3-oxoacyl-[acyl-carrier protein] reductase